MVKIIGIFAIVLVYYCEINAELDHLQNGKTITEVARKWFTVTTKKTRLGANISKVIKPNQTKEAQPRAKFTTGFPEDTGGPLIKFLIKIGEAHYNDLEQLLAETRRIYRDEENNQNERKDSESKKHAKKKKHHYSSEKHKDMQESDYKDNRHQMDKKQNKEGAENEKKDSSRNKPKKKKKHQHHSKKHEDIDYKDNIHHKDKKRTKADEENEEKERETYDHQKKNKHHNHSKNREDINNKDKTHKKHEKRDQVVKQNEKKESESNKPKKKNKHNHNSEKREDMKEDYEDRKHQKNKIRDKPVEENEEKESESNKPKKKKEINHHSDKREDTKQVDYKDRQRKIEEKTNQKDKKRNKEENNAVKRSRLTNSLEKEDKHTKKNIDRDKETSTRNTTRPYQSLTSDISKQTQNVTVKRIKKKETAAGKKTMRLANVQSLAMASNKDSKLQPGVSSKQVLATTTTPKPQPKPVKKGVEDRTKFKNKVALRTRKKKHGNEIRATRVVPLSMNKLYNREMKKIEDDAGRQGPNNGKGDKPKNPSHLSPYAIIAQMEELMNEFPKVNATITKFARTVEYNDIVLVTVTEKKDSLGRYLRAKESKYVEDVPEKKIIFIVHGLTVMGMKGLTSLVQMSELKLLLSYYFKHLHQFDIYLMPLANPDGYSASCSAHRTIWNKNVSPQSECPGVFVDRNFDVAWKRKREISSCSQLYPGAQPFSEVESKAIRDVFHQYSHKILAYIHVHSGTFHEKVFKGDAILYPRGYTEMQSDDDKYIDLKGEVDEAMKNASFRVMSVTVDTLASWYGVVAGSSVDYAATVFGIPYALEFVMQIYDKASLNNNALTEIWSRLIDTTFNNMWKSLRHVSEEKSEIALLT